MITPTLRSRPFLTYRYWSGAIYILVIPTVLLFGLSCAQKGLLHIPQENRIPIRLMTQDLTGTHADSGFVSLVNSLLEDDVIYVVKGPTKGSPFRKQGKIIQVGSNIFRPAYQGENGIVQVHGDLEWSYYGPKTSDIMDSFEGFMWLGLLGVALANGDENTFAAALQYRLTIRSEENIPSFIVRRAHQADVRNTSRKTLMEQVRYDTAKAFLWDLAGLFSQKTHLNLNEREYIVYSEDELNRKLEELRYQVQKDER